MRKEIRLLRWKGRKKNNRGSSMVMVLIVLALLMILVSVMMTVTVVNFRMKKANRSAQENFYTAESSLAEIRLGLAEDASVASNTAYSKVLERFNQYTEDERENKYWEQFKEKFKTESEIVTPSDANIDDYSIAYLQSLLKECPYDDATGVGAKVLTAEGENIVNWNDAKKCITLKNIVVAFYDQEGYMTKIKTDIAVKCPTMDFAKVAGMPTLQNFALVASDSVEVVNNVTASVKGDSFVGNTSMGIGSTLNFTKADSAWGRGLLIVGTNLQVNDSVLTLSDLEVWATNLVVNSGQATMDDSIMYLCNDVLLNNGVGGTPYVRLAGELYAYGNVESAVQAHNDLYGESSFILNDPANYSSSLIVNGHGIAGTNARATLDLTGLSVLKVSGNTYVDHADSGNTSMGISTDVLMGESIAARTSQVAYLIPAECIAPGTMNGGINPMPVSRYNALLEEIKNAGGTGDVVPINYTEPSETLGDSLENLGVTGYQMEAHQLVQLGSMIYFFASFDSERAAKNYYDNYYAQLGSPRLEGYLDTTRVDIALPDDLIDGNYSDATRGMKFYLNGSVLANDSGAKILVNTDFDGLLSESERAANRAEEITYHKNYAALRFKLVKGYNHLTESEMIADFGTLTPADWNLLLSGGGVIKQTPYEQLVKDMTHSGVRYFVAEDGSVAAIVNNRGAETFKVDDALMAELATKMDKDGNTHTDAELHVVLASGNVEVSTNYEGLLMTKGKVTFTQNVEITTDSLGVSKALMAEDAAGEHAYEFLENGEIYCIAGDGAEGMSVTPNGSRSILDYVNYENWTKQ